MTLVALFAALLVAVLSGIPIILAIGGVGLAGIVVLPDLAPALFVQRMFAILDNFSLLAMPYFILAGALMGHGGLSRALIEFGQSVVGHLRGSLGHTSVVACMVMANVSGSSAAEAAAIGSIVIPSMKEKGYPPGLAASIVGSAALIGPIIPPSMTMIVYGAMTGVSIGGLFMAGVIPGIMIGLALMATIYALSFLPAYAALAQRQPRATLAAILRSARKAWVALLAPVIILGGIFSGVFTATEAGIVACLYGLAAALRWPLASPPAAGPALFRRRSMRGRRSRSTSRRASTPWAEL
jgi:tripartite ATP-independent transporter DctM subunit